MLVQHNNFKQPIDDGFRFRPMRAGKGTNPKISQSH